MNSRHGLGRGLGALLPPSADLESKATELPIDAIAPNPNQPRKTLIMVSYVTYRRPWVRPESFSPSWFGGWAKAISSSSVSGVGAPQSSRA